jgi:hypothetical protein
MVRWTVNYNFHIVLYFIPRIFSLSLSLFFFYTNLDLFCIDNVRVIYRKIQCYLYDYRNFKHAFLVLIHNANWWDYKFVTRVFKDNMKQCDNIQNWYKIVFMSRSYMQNKFLHLEVLENNSMFPKNTRITMTHTQCIQTNQYAFLSQKCLTSLVMLYDAIYTAGNRQEVQSIFIVFGLIIVRYTLGAVWSSTSWEGTYASPTKCMLNIITKHFKFPIPLFYRKHSQCPTKSNISYAEIPVHWPGIHERRTTRHVFCQGARKNVEPTLFT